MLAELIRLARVGIPRVWIADAVFDAVRVELHTACSPIEIAQVSGVWYAESPVLRIKGMDVCRRRDRVIA